MRAPSLGTSRKAGFIIHQACTGTIRTRPLSERGHRWTEGWLTAERHQRGPVDSGTIVITKPWSAKNVLVSVLLQWRTEYHGGVLLCLRGPHRWPARNRCWDLLLICTLKTWSRHIWLRLILVAHNTTIKMSIVHYSWKVNYVIAQWSQ